GLITGITKGIVQAGWIDEKSHAAISLTVIGSGLFAYLGILVGTIAATEFGGSPALGALAGILIINPASSDIILFGTNIL
ncbi:PTS sugar transporter subunit IIC, partial [Bacillus pumilus]